MQFSQEIFIIPKIREPLKLFSIIDEYGVASCAFPPIFRGFFICLFHTSKDFVQIVDLIVFYKKTLMYYDVE